MAIQVILYQMVKDKNSTKRPVGPGNPYTVELKDRCSVVDPVLIFNFGTQDYPSGFNYVNIPAFENRCYWITNWQYYGGLWQASCHVDALASWRADIGASEQYILRAASDHNGNVVDNLYPTLASQTFISVLYDHAFFDAKTFSDGCFVVGIVSDDTTGPGGGVTYYQMDLATMQKFRNAMLKDINWANINTEEISTQLTKALLNPYQYVVSCKWFPFVPPNGGIAASVQFGWWSLSILSSYIAAQAYWDSDPVYFRGLPQHPQASARGNYLNLSPYTKRTAYIYPWGAIPLDTTMVGYSDTIKATCSVDLITGEGILYLYAVKDSADVLLCSRSTQIGVEVAISQIGIDASSVKGVVSDPVGSIVAAGGAALSSWLGGGDTASIGNAAMSTLTTTSTKGSNGGIMVFNQDAKIVSQFFDVADEDPVHRGRPLMAKRTVSSLSGFMMCDKPHVECHATADEIGEIESAMTSGFYWE